MTLRILLVHNYYQQPGGEDIIFSATKALLQSNGHEVIEYTAKNADINLMSNLSAALGVIWSRRSYFSLRKLIQESKPDIAHFHNTFLIISPASYYACQKEGIPVIQELHNYRLLCPNALLYRDEHPCEDCLGKYFPMPSIIHKCYRKSRSQTTVVAAMLTFHRLYGTWKNQIDAYLCLTQFAARKFIEGGLVAEKIIIKPSFIAKPKSKIMDQLGDYVIYIGRLTEEKGILQLLEVWRDLRIPLKIFGDGLLKQDVCRIITNIEHGFIEYLGFQSNRKMVLQSLQSARFLIFPSKWYEMLPVVILEAFSLGLPVIAAQRGAAVELIEDGKNGLLYNPDDSEDLAKKVRWLWNHPKDCIEMGLNARREYERKYTPERNYQMLMEIYHKAIIQHRRSN